MYYAINEAQAATARGMWSFSDYIPNSTTNEYRRSVDECFLIGESAKARTKSEKHGYIDYLCDKYAKRLAEYYNREISIQLMCPSVMICGASNFPVRKKEKQNAAGDRNHQFYIEIEEIKNKLNLVGTEKEIIKSGDPMAVELLQDKIDALTEKQEEMKAANAYFSKNKTLDGCPGITAENLEWLNRTGIYNCGENGTPLERQGRPFASYELSNNNACIKSAKERLARISAVKERGTVEQETQFFKVVENTEEMRLQLIFDDKPSAEIRNVLKENGFRWAPSQNAWQRQLTTNAKYALKSVEEKLKSTVA